MRRWITLLVAALFIFGAAQVALADWDIGFKGFLENPVNMADELKLTDEQAAKVRDLNETRFKEMSDLRDKQREAWFELKQQQFTPGVKQEQLQTKANEIKKLQEQRRAKHRECPDQMRGILTDEQYKHWCEYRDKHCPNPSGPQQGPGPGHGHGHHAR